MNSIELAKGLLQQKEGETISWPAMEQLARDFLEAVECFKYIRSFGGGDPYHVGESYYACLEMCADVRSKADAFLVEKLK